MVVSQMAFRARKVFGTFEKRAPGQGTGPSGVLVAQWVEHPTFCTNPAIGSFVHV